MARFDGHGRLDRSYGENGFAIPLRGASTYAQSLAVVNGEAYLAGYQNRDVLMAFVTDAELLGEIQRLRDAAGCAP